MKKIATLALGLSLATVLTVPAFADHMNARLKSVDATANTLTVVEGHKDYVFSVSTETHFLNPKGGELANGLNSGDLLPGSRLAIEYKKDKDTSLASQVKLRGPGKAKPATPAAPTAPATAPALP